jgi:hypothetical protein
LGNRVAKRAAAADDVEEDGIEDLTGAVHLGRPGGSVGERQMRLKEGPVDSTSERNGLRQCSSWGAVTQGLSGSGV